MLLKTAVVLVAFIFFIGIDAAANLSISIKGAKFYDADGDQFYIKGTCRSPQGHSAGAEQTLMAIAQVLPIRTSTTPSTTTSS